MDDPKLLVLPAFEKNVLRIAPMIGLPKCFTKHFIADNAKK